MGGDFRVVLADCSDDDVTYVAGQCHAMMCRAMAHLFECVAELKERGAIDRDGARDTAAWLRGRLHVGAGTSHEWAGAIDRLDDLPVLGEKFAHGALSFDQFRQVARFASPESDAGLAEEAPSMSVARLSRMAVAQKRVETRETQQAAGKRSFRCAWYEGDKSWRMWGCLPALEGQQLKDALEGIAEKAPVNPATGRRDPHDVRLADALVQAVNGTASPDVSLHVHCDAEDLSPTSSEAQERPRVPPHPEHGPVLSEPVLQQVACTAK